jgi:hypothetical protein
MDDELAKLLVWLVGKLAIRKDPKVCVSFCGSIGVSSGVRRSVETAREEIKKIPGKGGVNLDMEYVSETQ